MQNDDLALHKITYKDLSILLLKPRTKIIIPYGQWGYTEGCSRQEAIIKKQIEIISSVAEIWGKNNDISSMKKFFQQYKQVLNQRINTNNSQQKRAILDKDNFVRAFFCIAFLSGFSSGKVSKGFLCSVDAELPMIGCAQNFHAKEIFSRLAEQPDLMNFIKSNAPNLSQEFYAKIDPNIVFRPENSYFLAKYPDESVKIAKTLIKDVIYDSSINKDSIDYLCNCHKSIYDKAFRELYRERVKAFRKNFYPHSRGSFYSADKFVLQPIRKIYGQESQFYKDIYRYFCPIDAFKAKVCSSLIALR